MRKLTKLDEGLIEDLRTIQTAYAKEEEAQFQQLLSKLSVDDDDQHFIDFLFDYVYNSAAHSEEYLTYLKSHIYGSEE
jgi:hypothetical protein